MNFFHSIVLVDYDRSNLLLNLNYLQVFSPEREGQLASADRRENDDLFLASWI
jgi:hypothetical protein